MKKVKTLIFVLLVIPTSFLSAQNIEWNIKEGTLNMSPPTDIPFTIKIKELENAESLNLNFFIWDRTEEEKLNNLFPNNKWINFQKKIRKAGKNVHESAMMPLSGTNIYVANSPVILDANRVYLFGISGYRRFDPDKYIEDKDKLDEIFSDLTNSSKSEELVATRKISEDKFDVSKYFEQDDGEYIVTGSNYIVDVYSAKSNLEEFQAYNNSEVLAEREEAISKMEILKSDIISSLEDRVLVFAVYAFTFSEDINKRKQTYLLTQTGVGSSLNGKLYSSSSLIYFPKGYNSKVPMSMVRKRNWLRGIFLSGSVILLDFNGLIDEESTFGVLGDSGTVRLGAGYMFDDVLSIDFGAILLKKRKSDLQIITETAPAIALSISVNIDISSLLKKDQ